MMSTLLYLIYLVNISNENKITYITYLLKQGFCVRPVKVNASVGICFDFSGIFGTNLLFLSLLLGRVVKHADRKAFCVAQ